MLKFVFNFILTAFVVFVVAAVVIAAGFSMGVFVYPIP